MCINKAIINSLLILFFIHLKAYSKESAVGVWVHSDQLKSGMQVLASDNKVFTVVEAWQEKPNTDTTYNFEVKDTHTYFIGQGRIWTHNTGVCDEWYEPRLRSANSDSYLYSEAHSNPLDKRNFSNIMGEERAYGNDFGLDNEFIIGRVKAFKDPAVGKTISYDITMPSNAPKPYMDADELSTVVSNIAFDFRGYNKNILVVIRVKPTIQGMEPYHYRKIGERFGLRTFFADDGTIVYLVAGRSR